VKRFTIYAEDIKKRLDIFAVERLPELSRASVQKLCRQMNVLVNNKAEKQGYRLHEGDVVQIVYDPTRPDEIPDIDLPVLYEDDDVLVINKPAGVLTHSKGAFNPEPTVASWLNQRLSHHNPTFSRLSLESGGRGGIVHRLDRATSGVMITAKSPEALAWLQKQFSGRKVKKTYLAIVQGSPDPPEAIIDMPIERNPKKPQTFRAGANGKAAITAYETSETNSRYSLIKLVPQTGRTHQLRVHLKQIGYPIVGDSLYGGEVATRLYLHAFSLEITLPNRDRKIFKVPLPTEFVEFMKAT